MRRRAEFERWSTVTFAGVVLGVTAGCHHKRVQPVVLPPQTPVALVAVPEPELPTLQPTEPRLPAVPVAQAAAKPKKAKRRPGKNATTPAGTPPPAGAVRQAETTAPQVPGSQPEEQTPAQSEAIGALSVGGEGSPRTQQEATDLIGANERRLVGVNADTARSQAGLLSKVRNFQKEARQALQSGDAEGAKTLATKGKLLLDDLEAGGAR